MHKDRTIITFGENAEEAAPATNGFTTGCDIPPADGAASKTEPEQDVAPEILDAYLGEEDDKPEEKYTLSPDEEKTGEANSAEAPTEVAEMAPNETAEESFGIGSTKTADEINAESGSYSVENEIPPHSNAGSDAYDSNRLHTPGSSRSVKKREPKYVTRGVFVICLIAAIIFSSVISAGMAILISSSNSGTTRSKYLSESSQSESTGSDLTVAEIISKNENAVVEIVVSGTTTGQYGQQQVTEGAGSGVIVKSDGYIVTNYHVVEGATKVTVKLHNGESYSGTIVGGDRNKDIAVVKINAKKLDTVTVADSSKVKVGDLAIAIGNPLGQLGGTATTGIISALDRQLNIDGRTMTLMQTDAAINGGNSGGGLFDGEGNLIGIVDAKSSGVGIEGLGFAIPINSVKDTIDDIIKNEGKASKNQKSTPSIGIAISDITEENAQYYNLDGAGVYVAQVTGDNASKAGFKAGDKIVFFEGEAVDNSNALIEKVRKHKVGDVVTVIVSREGQQISIKTKLEESTSTSGSGN